jgi:hypothetical protein
MVRGTLLLSSVELPSWPGAKELAPIPVLMYLGTMVAIERTQTGVRIETRMLKVMKALAEYLDMSLGDLVEGMVLHAFEGRAPFGDETLDKIRQLKAVYGLDLTAEDAHRLDERDQR